MIDNLLQSINRAERNIRELNEKIRDAQLEIEKCYELKKVMENIIDNSTNGQISLQNVASSLDNGIIINGVGQGHKILERASKIKSLMLNASIANGNIDKRIAVLEMEIPMYKADINKLNNSISHWRSEISNIRAKAKMEKESKIEMGRAV